MTKLLLITHDELLAAAYASRLVKSGFDVEHRATGDEGLLKARRWSPDIILLDLTLPGMHGLDVIKWVREVPWLVKVPIVLLIERTLAKDVLEECLFWGAGSYVQKDTASLQEILAHVQTVLSAQPPAQRLPPPAKAEAS